MINRRSTLLGAIAVVATAVAPLFAFSAAAQADDWTTLFDGKSLDSWNKTGEANWRIEHGLIVADKGSGHLVTKTDCGDFAIRAEFWSIAKPIVDLYSARRRGESIFEDWLRGQYVR